MQKNHVPLTHSDVIKHAVNEFSWQYHDPLIYEYLTFHAQVL